jgi:hypothetical protein
MLVASARRVRHSDGHPAVDGAACVAPANIKYIVQAVNGVGLVSLDDNLGAYYSASEVRHRRAAATTLA